MAKNTNMGKKTPNEIRKNTNYKSECSNSTSENSEKTSENTNNTKFRLQAKNFFLTYKTHLDIDKYINFINKKFCKHKLEKWIIAHEKADKENEYLHSHILLCFDKKLNVINPRAFDFNEIHPYIVPVLSMIKVVRYCIKESKDTPENPNWHSNWDVVGYIEKYLNNKRISKAEKEHIRNKYAKIISHKNLYDALRNESSSLKDVNAIKTIFASKPVIIDKRLDRIYNNKELNDWQQQLYDRISIDPEVAYEQNSVKHCRTIRWVCDIIGSRGKSFFSEYCEYKHPGKHFVLNTSGTVKDLCDVLRNTIFDKGIFPDHIMINLARSVESQDIYTLIEMIKDGRITCTKYSGNTYSFFPPHVTVFANWMPKFNCLTDNRWLIYFLSGKRNKTELIIFKQLKHEKMDKLVQKEKILKKKLIEIEKKKSLENVDSEENYNTSNDDSTITKPKKPNHKPSDLIEIDGLYD